MAWSWALMRKPSVSDLSPALLSHWLVIWWSTSSSLLYSFWVLPMHWFIFPFLFQLILGMALCFLFTFSGIDIWSFNLRFQYFIEVELSSEHCSLARYGVLVRYILSTSAFGWCILCKVRNFLVFLSSCLIPSIFQSTMLKLWATTGIESVLMASTLLTALSSEYHSYSSIRLLFNLFFHFGVLYPVPFIPSQVFVCTFLL